MTDPILYFAPGTCARVPMTALEEIGQPFETRLVAFMAGDHRSPEFLALNPVGSVPVLVTRDATITQNNAILWYLARTYPDSGLLPPVRTPVEESRIIAMMAHLAADLHTRVSRIVLPFRYAASPEAQAEVYAIGTEQLTFLLQPMQDTLDRQPWLLGEHWSVIDSYLGWVWARITAAGFNAERFPALADHLARLHQRPAVQRCLAREAEAQAELAERGVMLRQISEG